MFRNLFRPDSALMITMTQITDCIFLSLFFLVGCFPLVTAGASATALYDAVYHAFRKGEKHSWHRFFHSFRRNLKPSLLPGLVFLAAVAALSWGGIRLWNSAVYGKLSWMLFAAAAFLMLLAVGMLSILFPLLSRFETTTPQLLGNAFRLGFVNLPLTLGLAMLNAGAAWLCLRYIFPLFFLPALAALISTLFIEPMLKPYMPKDEDAA